MYVRILLACAAGYLIGAISSARLIAALARQPKALEEVSLPVPGSEQQFRLRAQSATAASLALGPRWGFATMVLDMAKVALPTLAARLLWPQEPYHLLTAAAGLVGHIWPVYYGFRGGRGLSAVYGGLWGIDWLAIFATFTGGILLAVGILRQVTLAYFVPLWLLIPWFWYRTHDLRYVAYALFANVIFLIGMIPEIKEYQALKRQGIATDHAATLRRTAMGRGMLRIGRLFGVRE